MSGCALTMPSHHNIICLTNKHTCDWRKTLPKQTYRNIYFLNSLPLLTLNLSHSLTFSVRSSVTRARSQIKTSESYWVRSLLFHPGTNALVYSYSWSSSVSTLIISIGWVTVGLEQRLARPVAVHDQCWRSLLFLFTLLAYV